jgi:hypothetical protein
LLPFGGYAVMIASLFSEELGKSKIKLGKVIGAGGARDGLARLLDSVSDFTDAKSKDLNVGTLRGLKSRPRASE